MPVGPVDQPVPGYRPSSNHVPLNVNKTWKKVLHLTEPNAPIDFFHWRLKSCIRQPVQNGTNGACPGGRGARSAKCKIGRSAERRFSRVNILAKNREEIQLITRPKNPKTSLLLHIMSYSSLYFVIFRWFDHKNVKISALRANWGQISNICTFSSWQKQGRNSRFSYLGGGGKIQIFGQNIYPCRFFVSIYQSAERWCKKGSERRVLMQKRSKRGVEENRGARSGDVKKGRRAERKIMLCCVNCTKYNGKYSGRKRPPPRGGGINKLFFRNLKNRAKISYFIAKFPSHLRHF